MSPWVKRHRNVLPIAVLIGLGFGLALRYVAHMDALSDTILLATLVIGVKKTAYRSARRATGARSSSAPRTRRTIC